MKTNVALLDQYFDFILSNQIKEEKIVWIYNSSYNNFYSAYILAKNGLKNQAQNCARMGLEFQWDSELHMINHAKIFKKYKALYQMKQNIFNANANENTYVDTFPKVKYEDLFSKEKK
ncbi:MAG: hypothetical protein RBR93_10130 [Aliarcobacter butzleri]|nr:hypothetical protein [Aliarcobacter butzleri]